jgi:hypothetical protein
VKPQATLHEYARPRITAVFTDPPLAEPMDGSVNEALGLKAEG